MPMKAFTARPTAKKPSEARPSREVVLFSAAVFSLAVALLVAAAVFTLTHRWRYDHAGHLIVRTDTFTGRSEALYPQVGWRPVPN